MGRVASSTKYAARASSSTTLNRAVSSPAPSSISAPEPLNPGQLVTFYRLMYASRRIDDREIMLKRQQKIFFQVSGAGHEALQVAAAMAMRA